MPDLEGREGRERAIQQQVMPLFARQAQEVQQAREQRREPEWEDFSLALAAALLPTLGATYEQAGTVLGAQLGLDELGQGLQAGAAQWAGRRALDVARGVTDVSRERIQTAGPVIAREVAARRRRREREGLPLTDEEATAIAATALALRLGTVFGPNRAEVIAATEVTGAVTAGEEDTNNFVGTAIAVAGAVGLAGLAGAAAIQVADRVARRTDQEAAERYTLPVVRRAAERVIDRREQNRRVLTIWVTEEDAAVCPICVPLNRRPQSQWRRIIKTNPWLVRHKLVSKTLAQVRRQKGPPAHPNCRCWREVELVPIPQEA